MHRSLRAFTLLELTLVVVVLAVVAGSLIANLGDAEAQATNNVARAELAAVREAVRRFRADTGYLPKTGPFALARDRDGDGLIDDPGGIPVPTSPPSGFATVEEWVLWFESPANLGQLFQRPVLDPNQPLAHLAEWEPSRRRGWSGPYLTFEGAQQVGDDLQSSGLGDPRDGNPLEVPGVSDPFGGPILLFELHDAARARVVSCGADREYTPRTLSGVPDDQVLATGPAGEHDLGLFLLR